MDWKSVIAKLDELSDDHSREASIIKDASPVFAERLIARAHNCRDLSTALKAGLKKMKYVKKPVVIEAIEAIKIAEFIAEAGTNIPEWAQDAVMEKTLYMSADPNDATKKMLTVKTLEGHMAANYDDMIIRGIKGEIYPCKPDIFAESYDVFDENDMPEGYPRAKQANMG